MLFIKLHRVNFPTVKLCLFYIKLHLLGVLNTKGFIVDRCLLQFNDKDTSQNKSPMSAIDSVLLLVAYRWSRSRVSGGLADDSASQVASSTTRHLQLLAKRTALEAEAAFAMQR